MLNRIKRAIASLTIPIILATTVLITPPIVNPAVAQTGNLNFAAPQGDQVTPEDLQNLYHEVWAMIANSYHNPDALKNWTDWEHRYDGTLNTVPDLERALKEMTGSLKDPWTRYTTYAEIEQARKDATQGIVELGMMLEQQPDGSYKIDYIEWNSPAQKSALRRGDTVISIGGKKIKGMTSAALGKLLKAQAGTKIDVTYKDQSTQGTVTLNVARALADGPSARVIGDVLYMRLPDFSTPEMTAAFNDSIMQAGLKAKGKLKSIIFDLRGNPGGEFTQALSISSNFIADGTIVVSTTRDGRMVTKDEFRVIPALAASKSGADPDGIAFAQFLQTAPMVVLTDGNTASAAEITTGALKDTGRATILGTTTFGKAVGYVTGNPPTGGILYVTTLDYLTPSGYNLAHKGIAPHKVVEQPRDSKDDEQLKKAIEFLHKP